jgi:hypothetical protein
MDALVPARPGAETPPGPGPSSPAVARGADPYAALRADLGVGATIW